VNINVDGYKLAKPFDLEIEQQLLGALLLYNHEFDQVATFLEPIHFAEPLHGRIFHAIRQAIRAGITASPMTLRNELETDEALKTIGGTEYLAGLCGQARHCIDVGIWAKTVHGFAFRRRVVEAANDIASAARDASVEFTAERIAEYAENLLQSTTAEASPNAAERFKTLGAVSSDVLRKLDAGSSQGVAKFGLRDIDDATGGMRPGELIIIGARPGMGKTAVAAHIAQYNARAGIGVGFFSMEMSAEAVTLRVLTSLAFQRDRRADLNPAYETARRGKLKQFQKDELYALEGVLASVPLRIHEGRGLTPSGILVAAKRLRNELEAAGTPLGLILVDHLQKIRPDRALNGNKVGEMTEISDALQKMAGTLAVPVIGLSQLSRASEKRDDRRPELSDLRESGSIEQDADIVLLLYREAYYLKKREPAPHTAQHSEWFSEWELNRNKLEIQIAKQRNGPEGKHEIFFDAPSSALGDK